MKRPRFRIRRAFWRTAHPWIILDRERPGYVGRAATFAEAIALVDERISA